MSEHQNILSNLDMMYDRNELDDDQVDFDPIAPYESYDGDEITRPDFDEPVTLAEGGQELVRGLSTWFIPEKTDETTTQSTPNMMVDQQYSEENVKIDISFENAERNLKRQLQKQYLAISIGCWAFLTIVQTVALVTLKYWEYSPVLISVVLMLFASFVYWRHIWRHLGIPFARLWATPYPYTVSATILGCLAQHALFIIYGKYDAGQLLIIFFMIQAFYVILVSSTYRFYMYKWAKFIRHRKLCFESLQSHQLDSKRFAYTAM